MTTVILIAVAIVAVIAGIFVAVARAEKARTDRLQDVGATLGFSFEREGNLERLKAVADVPLFNRGHSKRVRNVLTGRSGEVDVAAFDYRYTVGHGKQAHTSNQTVALFQGASRTLPDFQMAPENFFFDKLNKVFGHQDIDFDSSPEFSSRYMLRGPDETAIRSAFTADAQSFFAAHQGWTMEAQAGAVAIYRAGERVKPEEVPMFLEQARAIIGALT